MLCVKGNYAVIRPDTSRRYWSPADSSEAAFSVILAGKQASGNGSTQFADTVSPVPVQHMVPHKKPAPATCFSENLQLLLERYTSWTGVRQDWKWFPPREATATHQHGLDTPVPTHSGINARNTKELTDLKLGQEEEINVHCIQQLQWCLHCGCSFLTLHQLHEDGHPRSFLHSSVQGDNFRTCQCSTCR